MRLREGGAICLGPHSLEVTEARLVFGQTPAQGMLQPQPGISCAPLGHLLCPCQAARASGCSIKILISEPGPRRLSAVLARPKSARSSYRPGGDTLPKAQCPRKVAPEAAPQRHVSQAGAEASCPLRAGTEPARVRSR